MSYSNSTNCSKTARRTKLRRWWFGALVALAACAHQTPAITAPRVPWQSLSITGTMQRGAAAAVSFVARLEPPARVTAAVVQPGLGVLATLEIDGRRAAFVLPNGRRTEFALTPERVQRVLGLPLWPEQVIALFGGEIPAALRDRTTIAAWRTIKKIRVPEQIRYQDAGEIVQVRLQEIDVQ